MGNSVVVHLIRHEKTKANWQRKYLGWTDEPIAIRKAVCSVPVHTETVYGSDLKRCRETAELYFPNARYLPFSGLRELDFGDFEMKTYEELKHFETYRRWIDAPYKVTPPTANLLLILKSGCWTRFIILWAAEESMCLSSMAG